MIRMYVVRHAQPADQEPGYSGNPNAPLGIHGKKQAECVAGQFVKWGSKLDAIYSSSLQRALMTAEPTHRQLGIPWHVWPALSETGRREWPKMRQLELDGQYNAHVEQQSRIKAEQGEFHPKLSHLHHTFPGVQVEQPYEWPDDWAPPLEAETREKTYSRAQRVIAAFRRKYDKADVRIAVVCHGAFGSVLINVLMGCSPCDHNRFSQAHSAISRIDIADDGETSMRMLNYLGHLTPDMITEGVSL